MRKRWLAWILSFALTLALLPAYAFAAGRPEATAYWIDMSAADARQMLREVAEGNKDGRVVFVYYGTDAASQTAAAQFAKYANENSCYMYNYYAGAGESLLADLAPLFGGTAPTTLPVAVTYNPGRGYLARESVSTLLSVPGMSDVNGLLTMMQESGIQYGGSTPPGPSAPDGGTDNAADYSGSSGCSIPGVGAYEWEVLRLVNQYRMTGHVQPLSIFEGLAAAADTRAGELKGYLSHTRPDGSGYETAFAGIPWNTHAENIASGQANPADVMYSWLHSSGHRANIERANKLHIGIGYCYEKNDAGFGYKRYWAQNFLSARNCVLYDMKLSRTSIPGGGYTNLEELLTAADVEVTMQCPVHGKCSMPLVAGMCTGYDPGASGDQNITVAYQDYQGVHLTASLTITADQMGGIAEVEEKHVHSWEAGANTAASCTEDGAVTYRCSCGEARAERTGSAMGHTFAPDENSAAYICQVCGTDISFALERAYEELREQARSETSWSFSGGTDDAVKAFLTAQIQKVLEENQAQGYRFEIQPLDQLVDAYRYRVVFWMEPEEPDIPVPGGEESGENEESVESENGENEESVESENGKNEESIESENGESEESGENESGESSQDDGGEEPLRSERLLHFAGFPELPSRLAAGADGENSGAVLMTEILTLKLSDLTAHNDTDQLYIADSGSDTEQPEPPVYTLSVYASPAAGGSVTGGGEFDENAVAVVKASANPGYRFVRWTEDGKEVGVSASCAVLVTADKTLTAEFVFVGGGSGSSGGSHGGSTPAAYPPVVKKPSGGGVSVTPGRPRAGDKVTVIPKPDTGYEVDQIHVTDNRGRAVSVTANPDGTYTFTQPGGTVEIEVIYQPVEAPAETPAEVPWSNPFRDVPEGVWYFEAVRFVSANGLMNGYSDGSFGPDQNLSRAQLAQILYNLAGAPAVTGGSVFADVAANQWYAPAITWAVENGVAGGYGNGLFGPGDNITREQLACMLWRYSGSPAAAAGELRFHDADKISGYALDALRWAVENGILNGYGSGELAPQGLATRAQAAQMLKNFMEKQET